ncbi:MAG: hypothetical protein QOH56_2837 [Pseudonocardiales bacterium]|jgi:P27 family predicted phage terminase small subunit|nr:hypothetical protein [Pseudonocardiales bacterium]
MAMTAPQVRLGADKFFEFAPGVIGMAKRGPAPMPTALRLLHGETRPSRINRDEPQPSAADVVCPSSLSEPAKVHWARLAPDLITQNVLTSWDVDTFGLLCEVLEINRVAMADLAENGTASVSVYRVLADGTALTRLSKNPSWTIARESAQLITTIGGRFGMNPSDRAALHVSPTDPHNPHDPRRLLS